MREREFKGKCIEVGQRGEYYGNWPSYAQSKKEPKEFE